MVKAGSTRAKTKRSTTHTRHEDKDLEWRKSATCSITRTILKRIAYPGTKCGKEQRDQSCRSAENMNRLRLDVCVHEGEFASTISKSDSDDASSSTRALKRVKSRGTITSEYDAKDERSGAAEMQHIS